MVSKNVASAKPGCVWIKTFDFVVFVHFVLFLKDKGNLFHKKADKNPALSTVIFKKLLFL